jgi:hypothetical protein
MPFAASKSMIRYDDVRGNPEILSLIKKADGCLAALGYTEHSVAHVCRVADLAGTILKELGYGEREVELDGKKYGIYRTYERNQDYIELYCERKGGVQ